LFSEGQPDWEAEPPINVVNPGRDLQADESIGVFLRRFFTGKKASGSNSKYKEFRPRPTTCAMHIAHTAFHGHLSDYHLFRQCTPEFQSRRSRSVRFSSISEHRRRRPHPR
jgi:hypothetical protein